MGRWLRHTAVGIFIENSTRSWNFHYCCPGLSKKPSIMAETDAKTSRCLSGDSLQNFSSKSDKEGFLCLCWSLEGEMSLGVTPNASAIKNRFSALSITCALSIRETVLLDKFVLSPNWDWDNPKAFLCYRIFSPTSIKSGDSITLFNTVTSFCWSKMSILYNK